MNHLLDTPTHYRLPWTRIQNAPVHLRAQVVATAFDGYGTPTRWAVIDLGMRLNKDNEFEDEPIPSSRDDAFLSRTRWDTAAEAAEAARQHFVP